MEYEVLHTNDNGTKQVKMTVDGHVLVQDFDADNLDDNVKHGMAVMQAELDRNVPSVVDNSDVGTVVQVNVLPTIPPEDFEPEQPLETE
jgi:hypothetical protein